MSNVLRISGRVAVGLLALLFAATVWPTLYRYEHTSWGLAPDILVRINRFTGSVDYLDLIEPLNPGGWRRLGPAR